MDTVIDGNHYATTARLDSFTQLHIARKLTPAMGAVSGLVDSKNDGKDKSLLTVIMFSYMPDSDAEYVIRKCLAVVMRRQADGTFARVQTNDGQLMFADISMPAMLALTMAVVEENVGDFFRTALLPLNQAPEVQNT